MLNLASPAMHLLILTLAILNLSPASAQGYIRPGPVFDCSIQSSKSSMLHVAQAITPNAAGASDCCAGGCCAIASTCVNRGTDNEGCCPVSDPTICGLYPTDSNSTSAPPPLPRPSVLCQDQFGLSDFYCPPGSSCDSVNDLCILPASSGGAVPSSVAMTERPSSTFSISSSASEVDSSMATRSSESSDEDETVNRTLAAPSNDGEPSTVFVTPTSSGDSSSAGPATVTLTPSASVASMGEGTSLKSCNDAYLAICGIMLLAFLFAAA